MQSRLLTHFLAVVERRNITAAAEALHITQPALTRNIHQLETFMGAELFERLPGGVRLTRAGEILARRARLMDIEYRYAVAEIQTLQRGLAGTLRVGAGPIWSGIILPPVVAAFHRQFPKVRIRQTDGVSHTLVDSLLAGDIDIMCGAVNFRAPDEVTKESLMKVQHIVVAGKSHPLAGREEVTARELSGYPWLVLADDLVGVGGIGAYFAANGVAPPTIAVESTSFGMMKMLSECNFLAHFAERLLPDAERFGLVRIPHEGTFWETEVGIAYRTTAAPFRALTSFIAMVKVAVSSKGDPGVPTEVDTSRSLDGARKPR